MRHTVQASQAHRRRDPLQPGRNGNFRDRGDSVVIDAVSAAADFHFTFLAAGAVEPGAGYALTHSPWFAVCAFVLFAAYVGGTAAFTALYVAENL